MTEKKKIEDHGKNKAAMLGCKYSHNRTLQLMRSMSSILDWRLLTELLLWVPCVITSNVLFYFNIWYIMMDNMQQDYFHRISMMWSHVFSWAHRANHLFVFTMKQNKKKKYWPISSAGRVMLSCQKKISITFFLCSLGDWLHIRGE